MNELEQAFRQMAEGLKAKEPRYTILDCEHVVDTVKDIEYHLEYGEVYAITMGENKTLILTGKQMTETEAGILMRVASELPKLYADAQRAYLRTILTAEVQTKGIASTKPTERYTP